MSFIHSTALILSLLLSFFSLALSKNAALPAQCHPYPGAVVQDCLQLIGDNINNDTAIPCVNNRATITLRQCSIVTQCNSTNAADSGNGIVIPSDSVRQALTTIGACALSDYGSVSGYYTTESGTKTCYLYPGYENLCQ